MILRIIIFAALLFLIEFYFFKRIFNSVKTVFSGFLLIKHKKVGVLLTVFLNIYPLFLIFAWTYASVSKTRILVPINTLFDYFILYPFWIYIFVVVQSILFFLLLDIIRLILFPLYRIIRAKVNIYQSAAVLIITAVFVVYVPYSVIYDYYNVQVRTVNYAGEDLPKELDGLKIVLIADVQADRYTDNARLGKYISLVNRQFPDLVLIGGDVITSTPDFINTAAKYLGKLKSRYGVFSCVGDHDNWAYGRNYSRSLREVKQALAKQNVMMFDNKDTVLNIGGRNVLITFITNTYVEHINKSELNILTNGTKKYALKILLTHQPRQNVVSQAVNNNYDLFFAGHTHGGQVTFLFPFLNLTPTLLETKYVRGNFVFGKMLIIVNRGLGMSLVPLRYNSEPEITIINIRRNNFM